MFKLISLVFILAHTSLSQIFNLTADDLFKSIIGDEFNKIKDPPKTYKELRTFDDFIVAKSPEKLVFINETHAKMRVVKEEHKTTSKTTANVMQVTPIPTEKRPNITIDEIKVRMRKIHLNKLLESLTTPIPDFSNDSDDPIHITRRFETIVKEVKTQRQPNFRRGQVYFENNDRNRIFKEKQRTISLMAQFIYATRYKLPYLQQLRKKYNYHLKYKIGYCFALLRHLKQQQKLIYSSLHNYYKHFNNLMTHIRLYEKVVRLDVDIRDVCQFVRRLNYLVKLEADPTYYDDPVNPVTNSTNIPPP